MRTTSSLATTIPMDAIPSVGALGEYLRATADNARVSQDAVAVLKEALSIPGTAGLNTASWRAHHFNSADLPLMLIHQEKLRARHTGALLDLNDVAQLGIAFRDVLAQLEQSSEVIASMANSIVQYRMGEAGTLVTGKEFAVLLNITEEAVRLRYQNGKLISIIREGRERGRGYPVFQAWPGIDGPPLEQILPALGYLGPSQGSVSGAAQVYQFFTGTHELLGGLTPIQVLTGVGADISDHEAVEFLATPHEERVKLVVSVAATTHAREERE